MFRPDRWRSPRASSGTSRATLSARPQNRKRAMGQTPSVEQTKRAVLERSARQGVLMTRTLDPAEGVVRNARESDGGPMTTVEESPRVVSSIPQDYTKRLMVFGGRASMELAAKISGKLGVDLG